MKLGILIFLAALGAGVSLVFALALMHHNTQSRLDEARAGVRQDLQAALLAKDEVISRDKVLADLQEEKVRSLQASLQAKDDLLAKDSALAASKDETIKSLQNSIHSNEEVIAKNQSLLSDNAATIRALQELSPKKEIAESGNEIVSDLAGNFTETGEHLYPADNGFDLQDLGAGFDALQVFGPFYNPNHNTLPPKQANRTPWKFGPGDSGIAANGSGYFVSGASNGNSNGKKSTTGQAGILEYFGSSISQSVSLPAGVFSVSFDFEGRKNYSANRIALFIDDKIVFKGIPTSSDQFQQATTNPFSLSKRGSHELRFLALGGSHDAVYPCTFIDNVRFNILRTSPSDRGGLTASVKVECETAKGSP